VKFAVKDPHLVLLSSTISTKLSPLQAILFLWALMKSHIRIRIETARSVERKEHFEKLCTASQSTKFPVWLPFNATSRMMPKSRGNGESKWP